MDKHRSCCAQASALAAKKEAAAAEAALETDLQAAKELAQNARAEQSKAEAARYAALEKSWQTSSACHCTLPVALSPKIPSLRHPCGCQDLLNAPP